MHAGPVSTQLAVPTAARSLETPQAARAAYEGPNAVQTLVNGALTFNFSPISKGGTYCSRPGQNKVCIRLHTHCSNKHPKNAVLCEIWGT